MPRIARGDRHEYCESAASWAASKTDDASPFRRSGASAQIGKWSEAWEVDDYWAGSQSPAEGLPTLLTSRPSQVDGRRSRRRIPTQVPQGLSAQTSTKMCGEWAMETSRNVGAWALEASRDVAREVGPWALETSMSAGRRALEVAPVVLEASRVAGRAALEAATTSGRVASAAVAVAASSLWEQVQEARARALEEATAESEALSDSEEEEDVAQPVLVVPQPALGEKAAHNGPLVGVEHFQPYFRPVASDALSSGAWQLKQAMPALPGPSPSPSPPRVVASVISEFRRPLSPSRVTRQFAA